MKSVVFLYSELAGYIVNCLNEVAESGIKVHLYHWKINSEAPFSFSFHANVIHKESEGLSIFDLQEEIEFFSPDLIVTSGWMDKKYLKVVRKFDGRIPSVLAMDNQWTGSPKQKLTSSLFGIYLKRFFSHAWVPGKKQEIFAKKLGFKQVNISLGFYLANRNNFISFSTIPKTKKRILYLGRYVKHKGIFELWDSFISLHENGFSDWELWCAGTGDEWNNKRLHPGIKHFGFVQPEEMKRLIEGTSVYILPSQFEPWGVSVQEMAFAGFPMILSDKIGSAELFLKNGENGFIFKAKDRDSLRHEMEKIMSFDFEKINSMGKISTELSSRLNMQKWKDTLSEFTLNKR